MIEQFRIREATAAGQFYPSSSEGIKKQIESFLDKKTVPQDAIACVLPHAGYAYSGEVAVKTVSRIKLKNKIILLGPNHTGLGKPFSIMTAGIWQTPLGKVKIDGALAGELLKKSRYLKDDSAAHLSEHSLEVEIPILQYFKTDFEIVPITILSDEIDILKKAGSEIAAVIKALKLKDEILLVASSDMTHYEPRAQAQQKDAKAIEAILELDEDKLTQSVRSLGITMCGYAPVAVMLVAAKLLGAQSGELVKYATSADTTADTSSVVGYAGIIIRV